MVLRQDFYPDRVTRSYYDGLDGPSIAYEPIKHRFDPSAFYMYDRVALEPEPAVLKARKIIGGGTGDDTSLRAELADHLIRDKRLESEFLKTIGEGSRDPSRHEHTA